MICNCFKQSREKVKKFVESKNFDLFVMSLICLDAIVLGMLTAEHIIDEIRDVLFVLDRLCMAIFVVEMFLKIYVYALKFFKSKWNLFDFTVIFLSAFSFANYFIVLRTFRLFRLFKYFNKFSKIKKILSIFGVLLPNFVAINLLFGVFLYVFAIMATSIFGNMFIEFSSLGNSVLTLIQIFTLDGWASEIANPVMRMFPHSWIFFVSFLLISFLLIVSFLTSVFDEIIKKDTKNTKEVKEAPKPLVIKKRKPKIKIKKKN